MGVNRIAALQAGLLLVAMFANAASRENAMRIKILDSETRSVSLGGNDVPKNCDQVNFDAYCNNSKSAILTNTLLVQEGNEPPFRIACTIDSRYSRCTPLPKGESFDARREKHGITVYYQDDNGKARKTVVHAGRYGRKDRSAGDCAPQLQLSQSRPPRMLQHRRRVHRCPAPTPRPDWLRAGSSCEEGKVQFQFDTLRCGNHH